MNVFLGLAIPQCYPWHALQIVKSHWCRSQIDVMLCHQHLPTQQEYPFLQISEFTSFLLSSLTNKASVMCFSSAAEMWFFVKFLYACIIRLKDDFVEKSDAERAALFQKLSSVWWDTSQLIRNRRKIWVQNHDPLNSRYQRKPRFSVGLIQCHMLEVDAGFGLTVEFIECFLNEWL
jgi:hypothetical protein